MIACLKKITVQSRRPETNIEYWLSIFALNCLMYLSAHAMVRIGCNDPRFSKVAEEHFRAKRLLERYMSEIAEKFGVIIPAGYLPSAKRPKKSGTIPYTNWFKETEKLAEVEYENIICSACPFNMGVLNMLNPDIMFNPTICPAINEEQLMPIITQVSGEEGFKKFQAKKDELKITRVLGIN